VWENVPGVLSSGGGRDFGAFLGALGECGYGFAYRVLDAQFFGVPQRRRRVFVVGHLGDWRPAAAVLLERESLRGNTQARRKARKEVARCLRGRANSSHREDSDNFIPETAPTLNANYGTKYGLDNQHIDGGAGLFVAFNIQTNDGGSHKRKDRPGGGMYVKETDTALTCGSTDRTLVMPINTQIATRGGKLGRSTGFGIGEDGDPAFTVQANHGHAVAFNWQSGGDVRLGVKTEQTSALQSNQTQAVGYVAFDMAQITSKINRTRAEEGLPISTLARDSRMHIAQVAPTLKGFGQGSGRAELTDGNGDGMIAYNNQEHYDVNTDQANAREVLFGLRKAIGEEAFSQWGLGIVASLQPKEVLQSEVHGGIVQGSVQGSPSCSAGPIPRKDNDQQGELLLMRQDGELGCSPQRRESIEQFIRQSASSLPQLSHEASPTKAFLSDLRVASQGIGILQQALSAAQEVGQSIHGEGEPICGTADGHRPDSTKGLLDSWLYEQASRARILRQALDATQASKGCLNTRKENGVVSMTVRRLTPL